MRFMTDFGIAFDALKFGGSGRIMRFLAGGRTVQASAGLHRFRFSCQSLDFCVYFRPLELEKPTAQTIVHALDNGEYDAYFIGSACEVFIYERKPTGSKRGRYGITFYNDKGEASYDNFDSPMMALPTLSIPALPFNGRVKLCDSADLYSRAYNMHCNRVGVAVNFSRRVMNVYRDSIVLKSDGLYYGFGLTTAQYPIETNGAKWKWVQEVGKHAVGNNRVTSVGVILTTI